MGIAIQGKVILFVTRSLWDEPHRGRHHLAEKLSEANEVIWVSRFRSKEEGHRWKSWQANPRLQILDPGWLPGGRFKRLLGGFRDRVRLNWCTRYLHKRQLTPDVVLICDSNAYQFAEFYSREDPQTLYYCNDYFGEGWKETNEFRLAREVSKVIVTAPKLRERFSPINANVYFVPHGTFDFNLSSRRYSCRSLRTVGYVGTIRSELDHHFFERILEETPYEVVLVGPIIETREEERKKWETLIRLPKVVYHGNQPKVALRGFMNDIDVLLLPYVRSKKSLYRFPLKFFDYLSVGRPIVATDFCRWPSPYRQYLRVFEEDEDICEVIEATWSVYDEHDWQRRLNFAKQNTWEARVLQISDILKA